MPWLPSEEKRHYAQALNHVCNMLDMRGWEAGHVTYILYAIAMRHHHAQPAHDKCRCAVSDSANYRMRSRVKACLQDALDEYRRCHMDTYEQGKREQNGDI